MKRRNLFALEIARRKGVDARCLVCKSDSELTVDHIRPISRGGTNNLDNLRILCRRCHTRLHQLKPIVPLIGRGGVKARRRNARLEMWTAPEEQKKAVFSSLAERNRNSWKRFLRKLSVIFRYETNI